MKMIKFPSIEQFRNVVSSVRRAASFEGLDEEGNPKYNPLLPMPVITFDGSVKLHGTNAAVCYDVASKEFWCQSRENIITPDKDNAGFAAKAYQDKQAYFKMFDHVANEAGLDDGIISIYGEWCGMGIQSGVGISQLPKMFVIFGCKITPPGVGEDNSVNAYWVKSEDLEAPELKIYNISSAPTYSIEIDFNKPDYVLEKLVELTISVEEECPFAKMLGVEGIGEGIVWKSEYNGQNYIFKTKGEKHSKSKVKTVKMTVAPEKLDSISKVVEQVTPGWRMKQGLTEVFDLNNGGQVDVKGMGDYLGWIMRDIMKEESDLLAANDLVPKDIGKYVNDASKKYLMSALNDFSSI